MKVFERAVLGATAFSCGMNLTKSDVVIEKNIFCASEFCQSFNIKKVKSDNNTLVENLKRRNILGNDGLYSPLPVSAFLSSILNQKNTNVLFDCKVTEIQKTDDGFLIEYFSKSGFNKILAKKIIDTTDIGVFSQLSSLSEKFYIAALDGYSGKTGDFEIIKGHLKDEYFLKMAVKDFDYVTARKNILKVAEENDFVIASFAPIFAFSYKEKFIKSDKNYTFIPSISFGDFISAYKASGELLWS